MPRHVCETELWARQRKGGGLYPNLRGPDKGIGDHMEGCSASSDDRNRDEIDGMNMSYQLSLRHATFSHSPHVRMLRTVLAPVFLAPLRGRHVALQQRAQQRMTAASSV